MTVSFNEETPTGAPSSTDAAAPRPDRVCLMVLGMHRSGTSALTRTLSLLGAALPENLLGTGPDNATGHWEPERLIALHDGMLAEAGSSWDDWRAFDPAALGAERLDYYRSAIANLLEEEYGAARLFVLKEPRICRFVPLYAEILGGMGVSPRFLLTHRNPLAVVRSLAKRDGMTPAFAQLLWLRHELDAEMATRGRPRCFLSYDDLLENWRGIVEQAGRSLQVEWPRSPDAAATDIGAHVSGEHRHHKLTAAELDSLPNVLPWTREAFLALTRLEADAADQAALARLDRVREGFGASVSVVGQATMTELTARQRRFHAHQLRFVALEKQAGEAYAALAATRKRADELDASKSNIERELFTEREMAHRAALEEMNARVEAALDEQARARAVSEEALAALERQLSDVRRTAATRQTALEEMNARMEADLEEQTRARAVSEETLAARIAALESELSEKRRTAAGVAKEMSTVIADNEAAIRRLHDEKAQLTEQLRSLQSSLSWRLTTPARRLKSAFTSSGDK